MERPLALDIQFLANSQVRLDIFDSRLVLAYIGAQSLLFDEICARQYKDKALAALKD